MGLFGFFGKKKKETLDKGLEKTKASVFSKLTRAIAGKSKVDEDVLDNLEEVLITSDVGVETTLKKLRTLIEESTEVGEAPLRLVCFTKGELQDQENKLKRSGLLPFFDDVEITSDKTQREFRALCEHQHIHPSELLMIGNSLKSDIAPALAIGAWGIHIPFHVTWQLEQYAVNNGVASLVEDFDHERLIKISQFSEILNYL
jgi:putative hydrolase of the HAD superfamily